jgi:phytoene dehydrogenase-like protein
MLAGSSAQYSKIAHHNIHFGRSWTGVFDELIDRQQLMSDPSVLVTNPTHSDPSLAPDGKHIYYVLFPTPNLDAPIDWRTEAPRYRDQVISTFLSLLRTNIDCMSVNLLVENQQGELINVGSTNGKTHGFPIKIFDGTMGGEALW